MTQRALVATLLVSVAACATSPAATPAPTPAPTLSTSPTVTADELRHDLFALAADSMHGRETGTPDATRTAFFLAGRLQELGLEPRGDSGYLQRVPLMRQSFTDATRFTVTTPSGTTTLRIPEDVAPLVSLGAGAPEPKRSASGEIVFAGYGVYEPKIGRDDLAPLSKMDVRGKVVVVIHGAPASADSVTRAKLEGQAELSARLGRLVPLQPAAIVVLMTGKTSEFYAQASPELLRSVVPAGRRETKSDAERPLPMMVLGLAKAGSPLLPTGWPADDKVQALAGRRFSGNIALQSEPFTAYNVVGVVPGTDMKLSATYVAYGAHYDHIGIQPGMTPDSIANGADDDGSGTTTLLAIARATRLAPPKRSVLFVWHVGEEKGLLGSSYFTAHPTVPIDSIVAQINADMIGRNGADSLYVVGPIAAPNGQSKVLGAIVDSVNAAQPRAFTIDRTFDDPGHPEHIYERSDHYNYARKGIPIVFFTTGLHPDYHKVSDEPQKIEYDKMARVGELMLQVGRAVGNRPGRPR